MLLRLRKRWKFCSVYDKPCHNITLFFRTQHLFLFFSFWHDSLRYFVTFCSLCVTRNVHVFLLLRNLLCACLPTQVCDIVHCAHFVTSTSQASAALYRRGVRHTVCAKHRPYCTRACSHALKTDQCTDAGKTRCLPFPRHTAHSWRSTYVEQHDRCTSLGKLNEDPG